MIDKVKERIEMEARQYAMKHSSAPDKETPDWIIQDYIAGATAEHERMKRLIFQIKPRDGKHFPEGWSREEIITILFE